MLQKDCERKVEKETFKDRLRVKESRRMIAESHFLPYFLIFGEREKKGLRMDRRTDGRMDGRTDGRTDGQTLL